MELLSFLGIEGFTALMIAENEAGCWAKTLFTAFNVWARAGDSFEPYIDDIWCEIMACAS